MCTEVELTGILLKYTLGGVIPFFSTKCYFLCLLAGIWFKTHVFIDITRKSITSELTENKEASSASNLHPLLRPFGKSLTYIKNKRGPAMKPCDTPSQVSTKAGHIKRLFVSCWSRNHLVYQSSLHIYRFDAVCKPIRHAKLYSRLFEISRNNPRISRPLSKALRNSWLIESSWLMQEFPGLKSECFWDIKSFSEKKLSISLQRNHSKKFLLQIDKSESRR